MFPTPVNYPHAVFKQTLRHHLETFFPSPELNRWFDPLVVDFDEEKKQLRLGFPHQYFRDWFMRAVKQDFERHAMAFAGNMAIVYEGDVRPCAPAHLGNTGTAAGGTESVKSRPAATDNAAGHQHTLLHRHFSFDTFLVNRKNDFPLAAAKECVAKAAHPPYTPFVIYGQSGAGKSHLLGAMANALHENGNPQYFGNITYLERIISSPGRHAPAAEQYVFIDDTQRVSACPEMQDALAALIDMFQASGRLLALSFDVHPAQSPGIGQKLSSRLAAGLVVEIKRPDLDIRRQYVQRKNTLHSLCLSKEQILAVAQRYQDIRGIDGALARLSAYRTLLNPGDGEGDPPAQDISSILDRGTEHTFLTPVSIILTVAREFSLPPEELTGKNRDKTASLARHIAILLCRELLGLSLVQTGRIFAGRDHSSVLYSIRKIKQLQASNKDMNKKVENLRKLCLTRR